MYSILYSVDNKEELLYGKGMHVSWWGHIVTFGQSVYDSQTPSLTRIML